MDKLYLSVPTVDELGPYADMLADPATMSYNAAWWPPEGCIPFPRGDWAAWHGRWVGQAPARFFAYLRQRGDGAVVGYVDYHRAPDRDCCDMGILLRASERGKGYGREGLQLLLDRAFRIDGVPRLHNVFEPTRAAALHLHKALGFRETGREEGLVHLTLDREDWLAAEDGAGSREADRIGRSPKEL
ncbi:MAG: GNAT family N-acetyltransferase [Oscillospiraceae bacterium]|nr:GNAT family N-acetyltransferase [Oscillospiraceae bacterium]